MRQDQVKEIANWDDWAELIAFYRTHIDVFVEDYFGASLKDTQKVIARAIGNRTNIKVVESRGLGKTWQVAWCCCAIAVLYPGTYIAVVSATAAQATLVLKKIQGFVSLYPQLLSEIASVLIEVWSPFLEMSS